MPLKSQAQIRKWGELVKEGKISQETFDEALKATPKKIPERVTQKKAPKSVVIKSVDQLRKIHKKMSK